MSAVIEMARRLGRSIAESQEAKNHHDARKAVRDRPDLDELMKAYQEHNAKVAQKEHEGKPVEVNDKHKLQELHDQIVASPELKKLSAAEVEYMDLMRRVNEAIQKEIHGEDPQANA